MGLDLDRLEFVEAGSTERPNRVDHSFTWKLSGFEVAGASYRYRVGVQGGEVGSFSEFLKVPEAWERDYQELRSRNETTSIVASLFLFATWVALLVRLVSSIRLQDVRWRFVLVLGSIAFVLTFLAETSTPCPWRCTASTPPAPSAASWREGVLAGRGHRPGSLAWPSPSSSLAASRSTAGGTAATSASRSSSCPRASAPSASSPAASSG